MLPLPRGAGSIPGPGWGSKIPHAKRWGRVSDPETRDYHTTWSKSEKERQIPYDITYMWNLKYDTNVSTKQKQTYREQTCGCPGGGGMGDGGETDWEFRVTRCKLLHLEWMDNKVLLYSRGNYIQCPGINRNGKGYKKEHIYTYIYIYMYIYIYIYL